MNARARHVLAATTIRLVIAAGLYTAGALAYGNRSAPPVVLVAGATIVVAFTLWATRGWVEWVAARIALGTKAGSYEAVRELLRQMSSTLAVDDVVPRLAEAAGRATGGPSAQVRVFMTRGEQWTQTWPPETVPARGAAVTVGVSHSGTDVGEIEVEVDPSQTSAFDRKMLTDLAGPAGIALTTVRLTHDLRRQRAELADIARRLTASRDRLLTARRDEQHRLRREVADQVITHIQDALTLVERADLPAAASAATRALDALRLVSRGIFPPTLDGSGLAAALDGWLERADLYAHIDDLPTREVPQQVQACLYFCAVTALSAPAADRTPPRRVHLQVAEHAVLTISGTGSIPREVQTVIADRAEAYDGTATFEHATVRVAVPLQESA
jgi:hypothetical protein